MLDQVSRFWYWVRLTYLLGQEDLVLDQKDFGTGSDEIWRWVIWSLILGYVDFGTGSV